MLLLIAVVYYFLLLLLSKKDGRIIRANGSSCTRWVIIFSVVGHFGLLLILVTHNATSAMWSVLRAKVEDQASLLPHQSQGGRVLPVSGART